MTPESWRRLEGLFQQAMALPGRERLRFASSAGGSDEEVRAALRRLILSHEADSGRLEEAIAGGAAALCRAAAVSRIGVRVGPYRITDILGQGGTSTVYLARRDDDVYEARVAIKILEPESARHETASRLRQEGRALARLDHPNVARIHDAGTTDDGAPFVVMELVEGLPLLEHCERRRLGLDERLRLFTAICSAVEHAHRSLVIHCDLKPGNVLVTPPGAPKLLDFGIATLLRPQGGRAAGGPDASQGSLMLTPGYASPEQSRGEPLTTATDIYSLGVL
ncbi:MAG TPA: serine/threonine-protein kinase, partial [Candidatus Polarisedimenticolia bacterium]|nr:serine/threonine-protein kinase [Candidatus Polarisedimenticolia bacterium]